MTRDEIMQLARDAGIEFQQHRGITGAWNTSTRGSQSIEKMERFAALVAAAEREACAKARAGKPKSFPRCGTGAFQDSYQFCYDKGWREGAAAVRKAIRARVQS